ncbi:MoaD/ThiS family protein [Methanobacterium alkalithermotolerans]|uniref:MoaD/ThiS family protein n=1 Tax=Methanobacterium alkalithermotolerans TaxID=2731220 RepID=A0A8T8K1Z4_9EURY|nr:MoaD/ThiS family protein [Methanobacterium alkalithermotolerans]QUH22506.1 MoaD/ThiS family protein [Methanobacterium alkalithermotolerans]
MTKIKFLGSIREITGEKEFNIDFKGNLGDILDILDERYGKFKENILDDNGKIKDYIKILINGESPDSEDFYAYSLKNSDEIVIFQTIAGG